MHPAYAGLADLSNEVHYNELECELQAQEGLKEHFECENPDTILI